MTNQPLVTVNILSYNRIDELRNTLTKVFEQDYKNIEVIVIDNASSDGTPEMVNQEFPDVKLIKLEKNVGISGWNKGFNIAKGDYILVLDDDSYPDKGTIEKGIKVVTNDITVGIIAFNVIDRKRNLSETASYKEPYLDFIGCGAIIRKNIFSMVGGFDPSIFIYAHEMDFSIRVLNAGFKIDYIADGFVYHRNLNNTKLHPINNGYRFYYQAVSYSQLLKKYLRKNKYYKIIFKLIINRFLVAAYFGLIREYLLLIKYLLSDKYNSSPCARLNIKGEVLLIYNFNVPLFDRGYFGGLIKNHSKFLFPFLFCSTFFFSIDRKNSFII